MSERDLGRELELAAIHFAAVQGTGLAAVAEAEETLRRQLHEAALRYAASYPAPSVVKCAACGTLVGTLCPRCDGYGDDPSRR